MHKDELLAYINRNCSLLTGFFASLAPQDSERLATEIADTPNPTKTAGRFDDLLSDDPLGFIAEILRQPNVRDPLVACVGGSRFLSSVLRRHPDFARPLFLERGLRETKSRDALEDDLRKLVVTVSNTSDLDKMLRTYKEQQYLRIGSRDLAADADTREIMAELSDLAAACVEAAVGFHMDRLVSKHGSPPGVDERGGFAVIGMGKVSGRELNFSSDVDLIFLRGPEEGRTGGPESVSVTRFYESLARSVTRSLSEVTEDGFVFRVDLRLRPEGEKGELVPSVNNALEYYLGWGRTWERAALMKAVPLAGDIQVGRSFVEELEPFIYRKYLDYSTLEDMRAMKINIETKLRRKPGVNIKLGQGGIREIEFFVQALQLINAGRTPKVRSPSTLTALDLLCETGLLDEKTREDLEDAYLFFRKTEHRIQINHQLQTHELPRTTEDQEELARRMGYRRNALGEFLSDLDKRRRHVEDLFSTLLYHSGEEIVQRVSAKARRIVESILDEDLSRHFMSMSGFEDPAASYPLLKKLVAPQQEDLGSEKGRRLLERLAPLFVDELLRVPEPGRALVALNNYIDSLSSTSAYFSTFLENPPTVGFLVRILGESRFFTDLLIRHPQSIDSLISRGAHDHPKEKELLSVLLFERLAYCDGLEDKLDVLRRFKNEEMLMIGVHHLEGTIESAAARWLITELAEACLDAAVDIAKDEMARKFGPVEMPDPFPFLVLGMGKFGGMEMTYMSDLDVIFIYDPPEGKMGRLSSHEWFSRFAGRIISVLSVPTSEGSAFAIDTRLRPSGNKGPLVSSLTSFKEYHGTTSKLWEKQALIRARPVQGPDSLAAEVDDIVRECIMRTDLSDEDIREIARLRSRMQNELALEDEQHVDLKTGRGGLVDVEFFVQGTILKQARHHPEIVCGNTPEAIAALRRAGLLDVQSFGILDSGYRFLSNLEDRLRIMENRSVDRMPLQGGKLKGLATRLGYGERGEDGLIEDYFNITSSIREIYNSFFHVNDNHRDRGANKGTLES